MMLRSFYHSNIPDQYSQYFLVLQETGGTWQIQDAQLNSIDIPFPRQYSRQQYLHLQLHRIHIQEYRHLSGKVYPEENPPQPLLVSLSYLAALSLNPLIIQWIFQTACRLSELQFLIFPFPI